ncbi:hypothetical protein DENSPDRAFT_835590 [Dentipellis sp. KUC8613]|nr:hypothetical protein DENSPDRAFT_835590 [Dentipellis sp. KUC8613]
MSASATDPASQLRQAALLTLKAKRRKAPLAPEQLLPPILSRPVVEETPSITLDYGEDDSAPTQPSAPSTSAAVGKSQPSSAQLGSAKGDSSATQDVSMREEGEISENEDEPSPSAPPQAPAQPVAPLKPASPVIHAPLARSPSLPTPAPPPSRPSLIDTDSAIRPVPTSSPSASSASRSHFSERTQPVTPKTTIDEYTALHRIGYIIDENHVRPGLTMTQDQYNTAKDIVLDLLGWGVAPEYLVHCGLSREIVYYVFTELNLRLPTDFDSTGILPFPPTKSVIAALFSSTTTPSTPTMRAAAAVQYPSGGSAIHGIVSASRVSNAQSPGASTSMNGLSAAAPTFIPKSSNPSSPSAEALSAAASLADMEQRTKRQLLARKAVLDSRKRGNSGATSSSHSASKAVTIDTKAASRPLAPAASVDDFLNSIDPTSAGSSSDKNTGLSRASTLIFASSDAMDVDDDIPGLSSGSFSKYFGASSSKPSATTQSAPVTAQDAPATTEPPNHSGSDDVASSSDEAKEKRAPGPSSNGNTLSRKKTEDASGDGFAAGASGAVPGSGSSSHSSSTPVPAVVPRRGTKRPVASDFVDVDSTYNANPYTVSSLSRTNSTNGNGAQEHGNGYTAIHHPNPHVRRKLNAAAAAAAGGTSFASVSNMRRCVIDVSDTEDEDGEEDGIQREASKAGPSRPSGTGSGGTPRPGSAMGEKSAVELELEIKKMREMIREREEMRLRKLAAQSNRSTRSSTPTAALPQSAAILVPHAASISVPGATMQEAPDFSASVRDTSEGAAMENSMDADPTPANGQPSTHAGGSSVSAVDQNDFHKLPPFTPTGYTVFLSLHDAPCFADLFALLVFHAAVFLPMPYATITRLANWGCVLVLFLAAEEAPAEAAPGTPHQVTGEQGK